MSAITDTYDALGGEAAFGPPVGEEVPTPDGRGTTRPFAGATFWSTPTTGTHEVHGLILVRYLELGGPAFLGYPVTDETLGRDGVGRTSGFEGGTIAWSPATGAWEVYGAIGALWQSQGGEGGPLGYPATGEQAHADGVGRTQWFGGGQLYWSEATGAVVLGAPGGGGSLADLLAAFGASLQPSPWHGLDRREVATRLGELLTDPDLVSQSNLNLCGPASFLRSWLRRDPVGVANFAVELYDTGRSTIGGYEVAPDDDACLATDYKDLQRRYGSAITPPAEWMIMSALRDAENAFFDYEGTPDEDVSAATTSGEVVEWLEACGRFGDVRDEANLFFTRGLDHARSLAPSPEQVVLVLLNTTMLPNEDGSVENVVLRQFPDHWVALEAPVVDVPGGVRLTYWCYGRTAPYRTVVVPTDAFEANYYGAVLAC
ncbi:hypothetical protein GCM10022197_05060 [Microlunatus spumicola]|uniref:LGFP repeat-containing protein n=1 Tax=Microlunatus spumicola TaxID=81499 RepID=A0ABP6WQ98_9ACTN